jgi:hypothetical protein
MRKAAILLVLIMVISLVHVTGIADVNLTDINGHWAKSDIEYLIGLDVVDGYPDGTFRPNNTINADAFIKLIVTALGYTDIVNGTEYWASTYIDKAKELGIVLDGEFSNYTVEISRADMSRIISRALGQKGETFPEYLEAYKGLILDYDSLGTEYKTSVLENICAGLITGYPDGNFKPNGLATRAEGVTVIVRLIQEDRRKKTVFADADSDWEGWINSEDAQEYCSYKNFRAVDGKIIFKVEKETGVYEEMFVLANEVTEINKMTYEIIKHLTNTAKTNGRYVNINYARYNSGYTSVFVGYTYSETQSMHSIYNFKFSLHDRKKEVDNNDFYYINHRLVMLWNSFDYSVDDIINMNYIVPEYKEAYREVFSIIYPDNSDEVYNFIIEKYKKEKEEQIEEDYKFNIGDIRIHYINDEGAVLYYWSTY